MYDNYIAVIYIFREKNMDAEFTVESFSAYLKDLNSEDNDSTFNLSKLISVQ